MPKFCIIVLVIIVLFISCGEQNENIHNAHSGQENIFYTCSMDPQVKENKPGKCPICHMDLTPIRNDETETNELKLSNQQIYLGNITTQTFSITQNNLHQKFTGELVFDQEKIKRISARAMGRIEKLYFKTVGEFIKVNQPVYELYSEEIAIAKQDFLYAGQQLSLPGDIGTNAERIYNSAKEKLKYFGLNERQIENLKNTKEVTPYTTFFSTSSGYINEIFVTEGGYVMEGDGVLETAGLTSLWLEAQVNANYSYGFFVGQAVNVSFNDFPALNVMTKISFVNPEINTATRLLLVRMNIDNRKLLLKPGMQGVASINRFKLKGLFVPIDAIIREGKASYIWLKKSPGVFKSQMVETGVEINGMIEIKTEIDSLKDVVITGAYAINSEYKFRKGSNPMEGHGM
ncbi:MAG TPA: efflux RND transporter periplasmic adaptor subunit [Saprospiraceae bacterium]|nr:efflux RND transporter periplasmic adaptor subunit [Saprospiraceae bacterium]